MIYKKIDNFLFKSQNFLLIIKFFIMETLKNDTKKILNETKKDVYSFLSDDKIIDILNSKSLIDSLDKVKVKESKIKSTNNNKDDFYKYDFLFKKYFNLDYSKIDKNDFTKYGKKIRTKIRNKRNIYANNVIHYAKNKNLIELKNEIKNFNIFYKETYLLNDYSLKSISNTNSDDDTKKLLITFLEIIKNLK